MVLYIIRHADPDYENNTITDFGWEEANALADWLKDFRIDKIYTSPMGRAIDTATPTCKVKEIDYEILPWAAESMDYMEGWHMTPNDTMSYSFSSQKGIYDFEDFYESDRMKTIESMVKSSDEFLASLGYERQGAFYKITKPNNSHIAVFCHGGFGAAWIAHLLNTAPATIYPQIRINTTSVTKFVFENEEDGYTRPTLKHLGQIDHIRRAGLRENNR